MIKSLPYSEITRYDGKWLVGLDFEVCQQPEYFMQVLAAYMADNIDCIDLVDCFYY